MPAPTLQACQAEPRHLRFVGRAAELERFRAMLEERPGAPRVLWIHGPGGVGKSTLAHELAFVAGEAGLPVVQVDARDVEPAPSAFAQQMAAALQPGPAAQLVLIDTFEVLAGLDRWLREVWLPTLPRSVTVVLLGRAPPNEGWRTDPGWQGLLEVVALGNFDRTEIASYLERRGVPPESRDRVAAFTRGYPLALAVAADGLLQRPGQELALEETPDVLEPLLRRLVGGVPSDAHREALDVCALANSTNEAVLAALVGGGDAPELFRWLRGLSCIEVGPSGSTPTTWRGKILSAELRWRNPDRFRELIVRLSKFFEGQVRASQGSSSWRWFAQIVYLGRHHPVLGEALGRTLTPGLTLDLADSRDVPALMAMVAKHEGPASARIAAHWLERGRGAVVLRGAEGRAPLAFLLILALERATPADLEVDPVARDCWNHLARTGALAPGEHASMVAWLTADGQSTESPLLVAVATAIAHHHATAPGLTYSFVVGHGTEGLQHFAKYSDFVPLEGLRWKLDELELGVFGKDWRRMSQQTWLARMQARATGLDPDLVVPSEAAPPPSPPLDREAFTGAVRTALTQFHEPHLLGHNPLLAARMVAAAAGTGAGPSQRVDVLRALVREAAEPLARVRKTERGYRALAATYLEPIGTQEHVAEVLDLPFSTYRRHLSRAIDAVVELLWMREQGRG